MGVLYTCNYQFNALLGWPKNLGSQPRGGRLTAASQLWTASQAPNPTPVGCSQPSLMGNSGSVPGDTIQVSVTWNAGSPTAPVNAVLTFTPAIDAQTNPIGGSPYVSGGTFVCSRLFPGVQNGRTSTYLFGPTDPYNGGLKGSYELTIVITDANGTQWSIDPEFDTGN